LTVDDRTQGVPPDLALIDELTGLCNRRYLRRRLGAEIARTARAGQPLGVLMIDVDRFKQINDSLGHLQGDAVLVAFARVLQAAMRAGDTLTRYAGDEFVILLPDADREAALRTAERLRTAITSHPLMLGERGLTVTASVGVAIYPEDGLDAQSLLAAADRGLYAVKRQGGDGIARAEPETNQITDALKAIGTTRLIGRQCEYHQLVQLLDEAFHGDGSAVLVTGEAGIGKTRLINELARVHVLRGGLWFQGLCSKETRNTPYRAVREALTAHWRARHRETASLIRSLPPWQQWELIKLMPDLEALPWELSVDVRQHNGADEYRLFETLSSLLGMLAQRTPVLFLLDDLHWSDDAGLRLWAHLARSLHRQRVLLCATCREEEMADESGTMPILQHAQELRRQGILHDIRLDRLSPDQVSALLTATLRASVAPALAAAIYRETEGNPFFVEETLRSLLEEERIWPTDTCWEARSSEVWPIPRSVQDLILRRVERLAPADQETIELASVAGEPCDLDVLLLTSDRTETELIGSLDRLLQARLLVEESGQAGPRYRFGHGKVRETLYARLSLARQRYWHRRVAEVLEQLYADQLDRVVEALAHHFERAGHDRHKTVHFLRRAGDRARAAYANQEALSYYGRALELAPSTDFVLRFDLLEARWRVYDLLGDRDAQQADLAEMARLTSASEDKALLARQQMAQATVLYTLGKHAEAAAAAQEALQWYSHLEDRKGQMRGTNLLGLIAWSFGDRAGAVRRFEQSLHLARTAEDKVGEAVCLNNLGVLHLHAGEYQRARVCNQQSLAISRGLGDRRRQSSALVNLAVISCHLGQYAQGRAYLEEALSLSEETGYLRNRGYCLSNLGRIALEQRHLEEASHHLQAARDVWATIGYRHGEAEVYDNLGRLALARQDYAGALAYLSQAQQIRDEVGETTRLIISAIICALAHLGLGELAAARACSNKAVDSLSADRERIEGVVEDAQEVYFTHYRVLKAAGEADEAMAFLQQAHALVMDQAALIEDPGLRRSFLENVRLNRGIVQAYTRVGG